MIQVYLNFGGNAREALRYYQQAFEAKDPYIMSFADMPEADRQGAAPGMEHMVIYGALMTYAGELQMSDDVPGRHPKPTSAHWISVTHADADALRRTFGFLARDGEVIMPPEPSFFSPLYGQVKDKYGFHWMLMLPSPLEAGSPEA